VRHEGDQLGPRLIDRLELGGACLGLALEPSFLDDPGQQVGDRAEVRDVGLGEITVLLGLNVQHPDRSIVPGERDGEHRGDEPPLVDAADPQEALVTADVGDHDRLARLGDAAGDALTERHARAPDLEAIEAVRRRQRQVQAVPIEQVERGDAGTQGVAGLVNDCLEELVPGVRGRRQASHPMEKPQLVELIGALDRRDLGLRHPPTIAEARFASSAPPVARPRPTRASARSW